MKAATTTTTNVVGDGKGVRDAIGEVCKSKLACFGCQELIPTIDKEEEALEEDDLELLEENTGASFRHRLTRLRRAHDSESPPAASSSRRKTVVRSEEEDIDNDDLELPQVQDIHNIWDDRTAGRDDEGDEDMDDMDNFIDYTDSEEEQGGGMDEAEREEKRKERRRLEKERRNAMRSRPELSGIDARCVYMMTCLSPPLNLHLQCMGRDL